MTQESVAKAILSAGIFSDSICKHWHAARSGEDVNFLGSEPSSCLPRSTETPHKHIDRRLCSLLIL